MKQIHKRYLILFFTGFVTFCCAEQDDKKEKIIEIINDVEYIRLMAMTPFDFDQSEAGFRKHLYLGQMNAANGHMEEAIDKMNISYRGNDVK